MNNVMTWTIGLGLIALTGCHDITITLDDQGGIDVGVDGTVTVAVDDGHEDGALSDDLTPLGAAMTSAASAPGDVVADVPMSLAAQLTTGFEVWNVSKIADELCVTSDIITDSGTQAISLCHDINDPYVGTVSDAAGSFEETLNLLVGELPPEPSDAELDRLTNWDGIDRFNQAIASTDATQAFWSALVEDTNPPVPEKTEDGCHAEYVICCISMVAVATTPVFILAFPGVIACAVNYEDCLNGLG